MERMWTPWRLGYILSDKQEGCVFCDMVDADDDRGMLILERNERAFLVLNKYPYNNGHLMAVPYHHADSLEKLTPEDMNGMMVMVERAVRALRYAMQPEGFNIGMNIGKVAGAGVKDHVHCHIVPRWGGDTNFMPVLAEVRLIPQDLWDTYDQLKQALKTIDNEP